MIKIFKKSFIWLVVISFFTNIFVNFPFAKVFANSQLFSDPKEHILNEEYIKEEANILYEIVEERTENAKAYKMSDGSIEYYYYDKVVHTNHNGSMNEVDSSIKSNSDYFESEAIKYDVKFPKKLHNNKKITFKYQDSFFNIIFDNINKTEAINNEQIDLSVNQLNRLDGNIIYKDIFDGVDLEYITNSISTKENIILNKYIKNFSYTYKIELHKLTLEENDGEIHFVNDQGDIIYTIDPYLMYDSKGNISYDVNMKIIKINEKEYEIEIIPNNEWLNAANYPIVIDPVINYKQNSLSSHVRLKRLVKGNTTTTITNNIEANRYVIHGTNEDVSVSTVMEMDLRYLPKNVMYNTARLVVRGLSDNVSAYPMKVNEITSNITFDEINGTSVYNKKFIVNHKLDTKNYYNFEIVDAINNNLNKDTILLEFTSGVTNQNDINLSFYGFNSSYGPSFVLKCFDTIGLKDYWTYHSTNINGVGNMYVNDYTGNLVIEDLDYSSTSARLTFNLKRYYNSYENEENIGYGNGWRYNLSERIIYDNNENYTYTKDYYALIDSTGNKTYYSKQTEVSTEDTINDNKEIIASYLSESGSDETIEIIANDENVKYRRIVNMEFVYYYDHEGYLVEYGKIDNYENEKIIISHTTISNNLKVINQVTDVVGNKAIFIYENNLLSKLEIYKKITDTENFELSNIVEYTYSDNYLRYVRKKIPKASGSPSSKETIYWVSYTYDNDNLLNNAKLLLNGNEEGLSFEYYDNTKKLHKYGKFSKIDNNIVEGNSNITINYDKQYTEFIGNNDYKTYYIFDSYGHTLNIYDSLGYVKYYKYESENTNQYLNNKITYESNSIYNGYNKIYNNSFEKYNTTQLVAGWNVENNSQNLVALDMNERIFGNYSLLMENTDSTTSPRVSQTIVLEGYKTYKIGVYVKTERLNEDATNGAYIDVVANDFSGNNIVTKNTNYSEINGKYAYLEQTFTINGEILAPYEVTISLCTSKGTRSHFDNINLNSKVNDCSYNLLDDASFENAKEGWINSSWSGGSTSNREPSVIYGSYERVLNSGKVLRQTINIVPTKEINYTFGGMINTNKSNVKIRIRFYSSSSNLYSDYYVINYNENLARPQYLMETLNIDAIYFYDQIIFEVVNDGNNTITIDNLVLKEDVGSTKYNYNEKGKVIKITDEKSDINVIRNNRRDITSINFDTISVDFLDTSYDTFNKNTVNVSGAVSNIKCSTLVDKTTGLVSGTLTGDETKGYFSTSTIYNKNSQYIGEVIDEFNNVTKYEYDEITELLQSVTDANQNETTYSYNDLRQLITLTKNSRSISYTYNDFRKIETVVIGDLQYTFSYNDHKDIINVSLKKISTGNVQNIISYEYFNKNGIYTGLVSKAIYQDGYTLSYYYDYDNLKLTSISEKMPNEIDVNKIYSCIYNQDLQISAYTDYLTNTTYYNNYDLNGNLVEVIDSNGNKVKYLYGGKNDTDTEYSDYLRKIEYSLIGNIVGEIYYLYDNDGDLISVKDNGILTSVLSSQNGEQDPLGRMITKTIYEGVNSSNQIIEYYYEYYSSPSTQNNPNIEDSNNSNTENLTSTRIDNVNIEVGTNNLQYEYEYDALGNITEVIVNKNDISNITKYQYQYDEYNQLVKETIYENTEKVLETEYTYDIYGNITKIQRLTRSEKYSNVPQMIELYYANSSNPTKLTQYKIDKVIYYVGYDANGAQLNHLNYTTKFVRGKLDSLLSGTNEVVKYNYNVNGSRIQKIIDSSLLNTNQDKTIDYIYLGTNLIRENHSDGTHLEYIYDETGIIGFKYYDNESIETYYYVKNIFGDIINIVNNSKEIVVTYTYDAYGNVIEIIQNNTNIGNINPYRYRSYYYDSETNLYYCNARYYNPQIGRFISSDEISCLDYSTFNGLNLYCYCGNNPVMNVDYNGHFSIFALVFTIVKVVTLIVAVAATINDIYQITRGNEDGEGIKVETNDDGVKIENSYKIVTPWMRYGYSFYLNHFNRDTRDIIQGSTPGVQFEWELHNYAYIYSKITKNEDYINRSKTLDLDKTIFADNHSDNDYVGTLSHIMKTSYMLVVNPIYWIYDLIVNGGYGE